LSSSAWMRKLLAVDAGVGSFLGGIGGGEKNVGWIAGVASSSEVIHSC